jgi:hypothetical protein
LYPRAASMTRVLVPTLGLLAEPQYTVAHDGIAPR